MKGKVRDLDRLLDIIEQCNFIVKYTDIEEDDFYRDEVLKLAVMKSLEIIGEAATHVSDETKINFDELEWKQMIRARNFYIHEYFKIQWPLVWLSIKKEIDFEKIKTYCSYIIEQIKTEL
jgi:uncharacterized protein with HEPN domain